MAEAGAPEPEAMPTTCTNIGEPMADIAGVGIIVGFAGQAIISLLLVGWIFFLSRHGGLDLKHEEGTHEHEIEKKRIENATEILMVGSDIQMTLGYAYLVTIFAGFAELSLYHLRLGFEILCLVGVVNAAALVCWMFCASKVQGPDAKYSLNAPLLSSRAGRPKRPSTFSEIKDWFRFLYRSGRFTPRHRVSLFFVIIFIVYCILLGQRLSRRWSYDPEANPTQCYSTVGITAPGATEPDTDRAYLSVTASWSVGSILAAVFGSAKRRRGLLILAIAQFPVHLYMIIALRTNNQALIEGNESENTWDFGQTTAVILLGATITELVRKSVEFWKFSNSDETREVIEGSTKSYDPTPLTRRDTNGLERGGTLENTPTSHTNGVPNVPYPDPVAPTAPGQEAAGQAGRQY